MQCAARVWMCGDSGGHLAGNGKHQGPSCQEGAVTSIGHDSLGFCRAAKDRREVEDHP